jgi:shikimate kinase
MKNLVLVGFMGSGKSSVGQRCAEKLHMNFVDTDALIEQRTGKSIPEIFRADGEPHFRALEKEVARELGAKSDHVIASGGGMICDDENARALRANGVVILLWADVETMLQRTSNAKNRPLLEGGEPRERIEKLLAQREPLYRKNSDHVVDTTGKSVKEVVNEVIELYRQRAASQL